MFNLRNIFRNRLIDDWRDQQTLTAAHVLNQVATDLRLRVDPEIVNAGWVDGLVSPGQFIAERITPTIREVAEPVVAMLLNEANTQLAELGDYHVDMINKRLADATATDSLAALTDVAIAAAPLGGGVALGVALPTMAVTTSGGLLGTGLLATTAISWPIVLAGGAAATVAVATGVVNASRIWDKATQRLRDKVTDHIHELLVLGKGSDLAILQQLSNAYAEAAIAMRKG